MFTVKYNRTTNHIDGLTVRTVSTQTDEEINASGVVDYYAENACPSLTRYRYAQGAQFEDVADALDAARAAGGRKLCKHCEKAAEAMIEAERVAREERLNRDPRGDEWMGRTIGDAVTVEFDGRTFETELTGADHITPGWTVAYVDEDGQRTDTFVVVTEDNIVKTEDKGGRIMATKKLKLKDVRGDVRIGAVPGADAIHALQDEPVNGRNVPLCPTRTKNPIQLWGPAMDQKPELELCAGCSKVVPTGEVVVSEEPVKIPGLELTVNQKVITPVEGDDKGETDMTKANDTTQVPADDVDGQITRVHEFVDAIKTAETQDQINALAGQAEDVITSLPTKHRTTLRTTVSDAKKARLTELTPEGDAVATGAEVARRVSADVADDFNAIEGVPELIKDGVKLFAEGVTLGLKLGNVGEKVAHTMLAMRQKITNPETGLPDLMADRKTTKNAAAEVYTLAKKAVADDDVERHNALETLKRATQNKMSDVLVDWVRAFDGPDREESLAVMRELFGDDVTEKVSDDAPLSEAVYALYADKGVELPRYGRTELARYDRRVKAIEGATKELEALKESGDDVNPKDVEALEAKVKDLKADVPDDVLAEKLAPVAEKTDAEKTAEALAAVKAQVEKAGKRFSKVKGAADKRKAKAELYAIIRAAADAFELDLSALVTSDDEE